jgi:hypothetical protein
MRPAAGSRAAPGPVPGDLSTDAARRLRAAALARAVGATDHADRLGPLLTGRLARQPQAVDRAVDATVGEAAHDLLTRGWRPAEVVRFAATRLDPAARSFLLDALAGTARWTAGAPWLAELRSVGARVWWSSARPHVTQWAERHGAGRPETLRAAVAALAVLAYVPRTDARVPGMPEPVATAPGTVVGDEKVAGRVDALLARATGTEFPEEAAACAAKAQDLLLRHAGAPAGPRRRPGDPRRLLVAVGAEVAGLLRRAAAAATLVPRPALPSGDPELAVPAGHGSSTGRRP